MFGLIKFIFFTFIAIVVGIFIGTVPIGGRTLADRMVSAYEASAPKVEQLVGSLKSESSPTPSETKSAAAATAAAAQAAGSRSAAPGAAGGTAHPAIAAANNSLQHAAASAPPPAPAGPVTAGAANRPDSFSNEDRDEVEKIIAARRAKQRAR